VPTILIRNGLVLGPPPVWEAARRDILVREGAIVAVGHLPDGDIRVDRIIDASRHLVAPGLINAHTHSPANLLPGTGDCLSHPAFMWLNQADTMNRTPREVYVSAMLGCIDFLLSGTTAVIDHFPEQNFSIEDVNSVVAAYRHAGLRAVVALRIFDGDYADIFPTGGLSGELVRCLAADNPLRPRPLGETIALVEDSIRTFGRVDRLIQVWPAPSNPSRCSDKLLTACAEIAERFDTGIHTHLLETRVQTEIARRQYGTTMVRHLDTLGLLSPRLSCAHTIWIDEADIELMGQRGAMVVHNPESNLKVGAGPAPTPAMLSRGLTVALGTDGRNTNDNLGLHEAMRLAAILHRPYEPDRRRWITAKQALEMATSGGAKALRLGSETGRIVPGARADLVLYDLDHAQWIPYNDPVQQLVFCETGGSVDTVLIDGRIVVEGSRITAFDAAAVLAEAGEMLGRVRVRNAAFRSVAARIADEV
jgi:5-methylthioadenosine/S-adenosylhomocysteine deaminase